MKERNEIDEKYKWNLKDIYSNEDDLHADLNKVKQSIEKIDSFKGKLHDKEKCLELFDFSKSVSLIFNKIASYAFLKHSEDLENTKYIELVAQVEMLSHQASVRQSFIAPELSKLSNESIYDMIEDERFKNNILELKEIVRHKPHVLTEAEETIVSKIGLFAGEFSEIFDMFDSVDIVIDKPKDSNGQEHVLTQANFSLLLEQPDRVLRKNAFENLYKAFRRLENTLATNYIANVKRDAAFSDIYKYDSTLQRRLFCINADRIVYDKLIENVNKHTPLLHRYFKIKKKILALDELHYYDIYLKLGSVNKSFSFENSLEIIKVALSRLGNEYVELVNKSVKERWMDIYPNKNKTTGAFSSGLYGVHAFVLLNNVDNLDSVFTTAHELGHAFHTYYSDTYQPYETSGYPIFLAEVASTANEILLIKHFFKTASTNEEKLFYLDKYLSMFKSTLFRQTMFSEFEGFAHSEIEKKQPLSKEKLRDFYANLNKKYHGKSLTHAEEIEYEWMRIPHFFRSFYTYQYSTGIVASINLISNILDEKEGAVEKYINFLKAGGSDYPVNILKSAGVDLTTDQPYDIAFKEMKWALDELEKLSEK